MTITTAKNCIWFTFVISYFDKIQFRPFSQFLPLSYFVVLIHLVVLFFFCLSYSTNSVPSVISYLWLFVPLSLFLFGLVISPLASRAKFLYFPWRFHSPNLIFFSISLHFFARRSKISKSHLLFSPIKAVATSG